MFSATLRALAASLLFLAVVSTVLFSWFGPAGEEQGSPLNEDGRLGKVLDVQGLAAVRPVGHTRWTPVCGPLLLKPGDEVRTEARGSHAVTLGLAAQARVILGPGSQVELPQAAEVRVLRGELEATAEKNAPLTLLGPAGQKVAIEGTQRYRVEAERLVAVAAEPLWLKGFKGTTTQDPLGSLVAQVDGRNVPLTVGYHKVTVEIRDQIARTVIEESFVNHTDAQLEGVFHFPLPQDASISGFGMWIGNELVEADVVEKQRAREIYETILREKRDPGLLEWSGGNIFKARVFPIFARSEKRIRISYTQVLPLEGNRYRYTYALQSELLRQHPLRELTLDVRVSSTVPLRHVTSPTHPARIERTKHAAHASFAAQEYTPSRDFEVVIEPASRAGDVVLIPHRRGDDGYFMLQLLPPGPAGGDRDLLADGEPLHLLLLADTSASMDATQRAQQTAVITALLAGLTPKDTVNVAACDVDCVWAFDLPRAVEPSVATAVQSFLAGRSSLGWTDLDKAFASAFRITHPRTHIVYVGDGIVTTADADPVAFAQRLRQQYQGRITHPTEPLTCHAIAVGSSFEPGVLRAIAGLGGGSVRRVTGEQTPQVVARDLLREMTRPGLRDVKVEFHGLRTARVYPEALPNVPAGTQQIMLGRYLPEGKDQVGEVVVTGTLEGKPVRFSTRVALRDAEEGNSFIPRLWARMHLDSLLEQGTSTAVRDEIIALSEEYHIITPYTSLLVLETDADRERFRVKRRFQMRDGERFFAAGRDAAQKELAQQQMQRAHAWRLGLRARALRQLADMGRQPRAPGRRGFRGGVLMDGLSRSAAGGAGLSEDELLLVDESESLVTEGLGRAAGRGGMSAPADDVSGWYFATELGRLADVELPRGEAAEWNEEMAAGSGERARFSREEADRKANLGDELVKALAEDSPVSKEMLEDLGGISQLTRDTEMLFEAQAPMYKRRSSPTSGAASFPGLEAGLAFGYPMSGPRASEESPGSRKLLGLFPALPAPPSPARPIRTAWTAPARELAQRLVRTEALRRLTGGLDLVLRTEVFDTRTGRLSARSQRRDLYSPRAWLYRTEADWQETLVHWCDGTERGVLTRTYQLGRVRPAQPADLATPPLDLPDLSLETLERRYPQYVPTLEKPAEDRVRLVLRLPGHTRHEVRLLVDTARHVVLSIEQVDAGQVSTTTRFEDFVAVAGSWWPRRILITDGEGQRTSQQTLAVQALTADELAGMMRQELSDRDSMLLVRMPLPSVASSRQALTRLGELQFEQPFVLLLHHAQHQQWKRAQPYLEQAEQLAKGKTGMRWLRLAYLHESRRHEELKEQLHAEARRLRDAATPPRGDELALAAHLLNEAAPTLQAHEVLALLDVLQAVYERQPAHRLARKQWLQQRLNHLRQAGQPQEVLRLARQLATDHAADLQLQRQYIQDLSASGDHDAALAWLQRALTLPTRWRPDEEEALRSTWAELLEAQGRYAELRTYLAEWVQRDPVGYTPYQEYLSILIRTDRLDQAFALVAEWLKEGRTRDEPKPAAAARLRAAVEAALGQANRVHGDRLDPRWRKPLAEVALFFARHETHVYLADMVLGNGRFRETDECREVRKALAATLQADLAELTPEQLGRFINWTGQGDPVLTAEAWSALAERLRKRWAAEPLPEVKHRLAQPLLQLLSRGQATEVLAFLRRQLREGPERYRAAYALQLFQALLQQPWSAEVEDEALALLTQVSDAEDPAARRAAAVAALYQATDRLVQARVDASLKQVEKLEQLPRTELVRKRADALRQARQGFSDRLQRESARAAADPPWQAWLTVERLFLDVRLERNLPQVAEQCWTYLGDRPRAADDTPVLEATLHHRYLLTLMHLASRRDAAPALVTRLLQYLDAAIAAEATEQRGKALKYQLLLALDRPQDLERTLRDWIKTEDGDGRWRLALGMVVAEQGRLAQAIELFEAAEQAGDLDAAAYRTLAGWYLALGRRDAQDRALLASYQSLSEGQLYRQLRMHLQLVQRSDGQAPGALSAEVPVLITALFTKATYPQNYLSPVQQLYQATRDFRLLRGLADAVLGHTPARGYALIQEMQGVLTEVRDEAVADEMLDHVKALRGRAQTATDRRALDLLEVQVARRAAEVQNQPGPHVQAALAALRRACQRPDAPGETRALADFLAGLGQVTQPPLAEEQLRLLRTLHGQATAGTLDRLHCAHRLADALASYRRAGEAADLLDVALREYQDAHDGTLPVEAQGALARLVSLLEGERHFARAEKQLLARLRRPLHREQSLWLAQQLDETYHRALQQGGTVALGSGQELYRALVARLLERLQTPEPGYRYALVSRLCQVYRTAQDQKLAGVVGDLRTFAFTFLPEALRTQDHNHDALVSTVASTVHDVAGPREGLSFLVERLERAPGWYIYSGRHGWSQQGHTLSVWRKEVKDLGELEARLLRLVVAELRRDLETQQGNQRNLYYRHNEYFWEEKADVFAQTAEAFLAEHPGSEAVVRQVATYLYRGLDRPARAIEILQQAHRQRPLSESGQVELVSYLHERGRHPDSLAILQPLVAQRPDNMEYRVLLLRAYARADRPAELRALLRATDAHFHQGERWTVTHLAQLAGVCLEAGLHAEAVAYYQELIPRYKQQLTRQVGDATLSGYYMGLARAYAGLGKTPEAVDAAGAAVVAWGRDHHDRTRALETLQQVLRDAPNLDAFAAQLDRQAAETGQDRPVVRKAMGQVYLDRQEFARAMRQLQLAVELQPGDAETHQLLVAAHDKQGDPAGAAQQLVRWTQLSRRDVKLYQEMGLRFEKLGRSQEVERAYTSMVEMLPHEAEGHTLLAEVRQKQNRWAEAITHWERVAQLRALEPTGLLKLAAAQIHARQWDAAAATLHRLGSQPWPPRFTDVREQVRVLEQQMEQARKK